MIEKLLCETAEKMRLYREQNPDKTTDYNIFKVLEVTEKEVILCRMLADLLNPYGYHKHGSIFLRLFLTEVLQVENFTERELSAAEVFKEYLIPSSDKRIDLVLRVGKCFIPIEVKINAFDQNAQCYDYYHYALKMNNGKAIVYYLTKYGTMPSSWSMVSKGDRLTKNSIKCISFKTEIRCWLIKCIEKADGSVKEILKQYLQTVEEFTGTMEEGAAETVQEVLLKSREFFEAGIGIERAMADAKEKLLTNVFEEFEKQIKIEDFSCELIPLGADSWYHYRQQMPLYYKQRGTFFPGINYWIPDVNLGDGKQLWFRIEVEQHLYAGFCLFDSIADEQVDEMSDDLKVILKKYMNVNVIDNEYWWVKWIYLPTGTHETGIGEDAVPDFKYMNESAIALVDKQICELFIKQAIEKLKENLFSILMLTSNKE